MNDPLTLPCRILNGPHEHQEPQEKIMVTFRGLARYAFAEPFRPYFIRMVGGDVIEIRHPEAVSIGRSTARISTFWEDQPEPASPREYEISLELMESVEPLNAMSDLDNKQ
jgi:hypothetical protein